MKGFETCPSGGVGPESSAKGRRLAPAGARQAGTRALCLLLRRVEVPQCCQSLHLEASAQPPTTLQTPVTLLGPWTPKRKGRKSSHFYPLGPDGEMERSPQVRNRWG